MPSYEVRFYIGERDANGIPAIDASYGPTLGVMIIANAYGGATSYRTQGSWIAPDGRVVTEGSYVIEAVVRDDRLPTVRENALLLKSSYGQETVLYTVKPLLNAEFV